jgi:hypothetical protein
MPLLMPLSADFDRTVQDEAGRCTVAHLRRQRRTG